MTFRLRRARRAAPTARPRPELLVVMPVLDVARYVVDAATSVLEQEGVDIVLAVVDDGSSDATVRRVRRLARRHPALVLIERHHAGQGAARNAALAAIDSDFVAFADGDDEVPPGSYAAMIASLRETGSDVCLGNVERFDGSRSWTTAWAREVHGVTRVAVTLDEFPLAIKDVLACNRVIRRSFWDQAVGGFPEDVVYEDHEPMLRALVRARSVDVLDRVVYRWRSRPEGTSTGQQKHRLENLRDRLVVKDRAWHELQDPSISDTVRSAWLGRVLDVDLPPFVERAVEAGDEYRSTVSEAARTYWERADEAAWAYVRAQQRARVALAAESRWEELARFTSEVKETGLRPWTRVDESGVVLHHPSLDRLSPSARQLAPYQTTASARLEGIEVTDGRAAVRLVVALSTLDLASASGVHVDVSAGDASARAATRPTGPGRSSLTVVASWDVGDLPERRSTVRVDVRIGAMGWSTGVRVPRPGLVDPSPGGVATRDEGGLLAVGAP